jgi:prevent-host-death family protein
MKTVSARDANHRFSEILNAAERGNKVVITRYGRPVAVIAPYRAAKTPGSREAAIKKMVATMKKGLPWPKGAGPFTRDEMHER